MNRPVGENQPGEMAWLKKFRLHPGAAAALAAVAAILFSVVAHSAMSSGAHLGVVFAWFGGLIVVMAILGWFTERPARDAHGTSYDRIPAFAVAAPDSDDAEVARLRIDLGRSRVRADALQEQLSSQAATVRRAERLAGKSALRIEQLTEALVAAGLEVPADAT